MLDASRVKTKKLYYDDAYAVEFKAVCENWDGGDVVLDSTLFFPEEGGQNPDTGFIAGYKVTDVQIKDGVIHHYIDIKAGPVDPDTGNEINPDLAGPAMEGRTLKGRIDWDHRFSNMQQHSGEHILSGFVNRIYGFNNVGFHLSNNEVTLDFDGVIPKEDIGELERKVNAAISSNVESKVLFLQGEESRVMDYRSKLELEGEVRVVVFPGYDACACCAPHVARTGEIGLLKIVSMINYKGGVRLSMLCGQRALALFQQDHDIVTETARYLTTACEEILPSVKKAKEEVAGLKCVLKEMGKKLLAADIAALPREGSVLLFEEECDPGLARNAITELAGERDGFAACFIGTDKTGYQYIVGSREDARKVNQALKEALAARGGGSPKMCQGSLKASEAQIRELLGKM